MSKTFFDIAISLDGFIAGGNRSAQNTIGDDGMTLHNWMFVQKAFWEHLGTTDGSEDGPDGNIIRETIARTGSCIMGKRMFEEGEPNWPENLFKSDVYVLTNEKREPWVQKGTTTFYFINDGIEIAFEKAKQSAKGKDVRIMGGADTLQQFLNARLVDEFLLHITPVLLGSGLRLFDSVDKNKFDIQITNVIQSPLTTHLYYKLTNK
jgi:dihydrofolate reductase